MSYSDTLNGSCELLIFLYRNRNGSTEGPTVELYLIDIEWINEKLFFLYIKTLQYSKS